jgi:hypothetical protein
MRARYYETGTGRFISEDPAKEGANWYVYANNVPILFADPSGNFAQFLVGGLIGLGIGLVVGIAQAVGLYYANAPVRELLGAIIGQAVAGFLGGMAGAGTGSVMLGAAVQGAVSSAVSDMIAGKGFNGKRYCLVRVCRLQWPGFAVLDCNLVSKTFLCRKLQMVQNGPST